MLKVNCECDRNYLPVNIIIGSLDRGGTERHLSQILPGLSKKGYQFRVIPIGGPGEFASVLEAAGIEIVPPVHRCYSMAWVWVLKVFLHFLWQAWKYRTAIFHFYLPGSYLIGMTACMLTLHRGPRIMSRRSLNEYQRAVPIRTRLEYFFHRHISAALGNSTAIVKQLQSEGIPEKRIHLIHNGIETERFEKAQSIRPELGIGEKTLVLTMIANLHPYKGHADLLDALALAVPNLPDDWLLLCVGLDTGLGRFLHVRARESGIGEKIRWMGSRGDIENILAGSDIALLPSHEEGFSNAILESMASGLPLIATDVGGNAEIIGKDSACGLLVPAKNVEKLSQAILHLAGDVDLRHKMGIAAKERVRTEFSLEKCLDNYDRFYLNILSECKRSRF